jgi:hypothetical protein
VHGFFSASPARCWRLMYGLLKDWGLLSEQEMNSPHFAHPRFSHQVPMCCFPAVSNRVVTLAVGKSCTACLPASAVVQVGVPRRSRNCAM